MVIYGNMPIYTYPAAYLEDRSIQLYDPLRDNLHLMHNRDFLRRMLVHKDL